MKPPLAWFGGKAQVAPVIWAALGDVHTYLEPFAGMLGALLARPQPWKGRELVNDLNGHVANFWRVVQTQAEAMMAIAAMIPWTEVEHRAHGKALLREEGVLTAHLIADPAWSDVRAAAWWYRHAQWSIGFPLAHPTARPAITHPHRPAPAGDVMALQLRLRNVVVLCGEWARLVAPSVLGVMARPVGILLDPPYAGHAKLYSRQEVAHEVREWAVRHGEEDGLRLVVCGYPGLDMPKPWRRESWWARGRQNEVREEWLWLSPGCEDPETGQMGLWREGNDDESGSAGNGIIGHCRSRIPEGALEASTGGEDVRGDGDHAVVLRLREADGDD